jgi:hypothetical protein
VVPEKDYLKMVQRLEAMEAMEAGDVAESRRRKAEGPSRPYSELRRKLGLA